MGKRAWMAIAAVLALVAAGAVLTACGDDSEETEVTAMSFNIWGGGANEKKPIDETVAAIQAAEADVIGVQETRLEGPLCTAEFCPPRGPSVAQDLADALGYEVYEQKAVNEALWANAILSRYPIKGATPNDLGVELDVDGRSVYAFNIHLDDAPYQPYQLLDIKYGKAPFIDTAEQAVASAEETRGPAIELFREDLAEADDADAAFVFGDFNEPSGRDWTEEAVEAGNQPIAVDWPSSQAVEDEGFVDAYREANPDPVSQDRLHLDADQQADGEVGPPRPHRLRLRPRRRPHGRGRLDRRRGRAAGLGDRRRPVAQRPPRGGRDRRLLAAGT